VGRRRIRRRQAHQSQEHRAIIDAIHSGALVNAKTERDPVFGFNIVEVPGVPADILRPRESWADKSAYDATAKKLASLFNKNFAACAAGASAEESRSARGLTDELLFELPQDAACSAPSACWLSCAWSGWRSGA
jgi:ATP-dependent phosphoenolpyruvate carboxykinase